MFKYENHYLEVGQASFGQSPLCVFFQILIVLPFEFHHVPMISLVILKITQASPNQVIYAKFQLREKNSKFSVIIKRQKYLDR